MNRLKGVSKTVYYISFPLSFIGFILPVYASNLGSSPTEIGILYSAASFCSILIRPVVGSWIDKRGRRSGIIIGALAYAIAILFYLLADGYALIIIARVIQSAAASFLWVSVNAMAADVSEDGDRAENFGLIEQYSNRGGYIGSSIGFTIMFSMKSGQNLKLVFLIYLLVSVYALFNSLINTNETMKSKDRVIDNKLEKNTQFIAYIIIMGVLSVIYSITAPIYLVYLKETITKDLALISFLFVPGSTLSLFLPSRMGRLSDKIGRKRMLIAGMSLSGILTIMLPLIKGYYSFMVLYTLMTFAGQISSPAESALVTEITGGNQSGRAYGSYRLATGIGGIIGPVVGAVVYQYLGRRTIFYVEGVALMAAAIAIGIVIKDRKAIQYEIAKSEI